MIDRYLSRLFIPVVAAAAALVPQVSFAGAGEVGAEYMRLRIGPRGIAMADAYSAISDDAFGTEWNPAGLWLVDGLKVSAFHSEWLAGIQNESLGVVAPTGKGVVGGDIRFLHTGSVQRIEDGVANNTFSPYAVATTLSFAAPLGNCLGLGVGIKYFQENLDTEIYPGGAVDIGLAGKSGKGRLGWGMVARNLGAPIGGTLPPMEFAVGGMSNVTFPRQYVEMNFALDAVKPWERMPYLAFGMEHWLFDTVAVRLGYQYDFQYNWGEHPLGDLMGLRGGIGLKIGGATFDYALARMGTMGYVHFGTIGWCFGKPSPEAKLVISAEPFIVSPNGDKYQDSTVFTVTGQELDKVKDWVFEIRDEHGMAVRRMSGEALPVQLTWDGLDDTGKVVDDGKYTAFIKAKEKGMLDVVSPGESVLIDVTPPQTEISISPQLISPDEDGKDDIAIFSLIANETITRIKEWSLRIMTGADKIARHWTGAGPPPEEVEWDGLDEVYNKVVPDGQYDVVFECQDIAGNSAVSKSSVTVKVPPKIITKEVKVVEEKKGLVISLSSQVLFGSGKYKLQPDAARALDEVVQVIQAYPENKVSIEGHSDSVGSDEVNKKLSVQRAEAVRDYLVNKGVDTDRLQVVGWGEEKPIASNRTVAGRVQNRRVEVVILK